MTASVIEDDQIDPHFDLPAQGNPRRRMAFFGGDAGPVEVPVFARAARSTGPIDGPLIIEEDDATCVVPPGWTATLDRHNNVVIEVS